jgi:hypothetical protein
MEENENIVLIDEDGNEMETAFIDSIDMDDQKYFVLSIVEGGLEDETEDNEDVDDEGYVNEDEDEVEKIIIMRVKEENDEFIYESIEDEVEFNKVFDEFKNRYDDEYEIVGE